MPASSLRKQVDLSHDWTFVRGRRPLRWLKGIGPDQGAMVDLPHCWNTREAFRPGARVYRGYGSYRKHFQVPGDIVEHDDVTWWLEAEGFYGTGEVWLNGHKLGRVDGQYLGFRLNVGARLFSASENLLGVRLTNDCASHVLPGIRTPDFILYGGLSGRVRLCRRPCLHLDPTATRIVSRPENGDGALVRIHFAVANDSPRTRSCHAAWSLVDPRGRTVEAVASEPVSIPPHAHSPVTAVQTHVRPAMTWSPERPALYTARARVVESDRVQDRLDVRFGIRDARFLPWKGFHLNGRRVQLRGCNRHESLPGFGSALPVAFHREDAQRLRQLGVNFVRLSHYPQHPAFLDACDELGILVYAEIASWKSVRGGRWLDAAVRQMEAMVRRDRNRPSVILWGMGNESRSRRAFRVLRETARRLDPDRPVIYAENHLYRARRSKTLGMPDVWGCNYELGALREGCAASRMKAVVVSECCNYPHAIRGRLDEERRQVELMEKDLKEIAGSEFAAGFALWSFSDYATVRKRRWRRYCGVVDAWRVPKMSAAFLQALCLTSPFVKVFADWGVRAGSEGGRRRVDVFTNCERVVLSCRGRPLASLTGGPHRTGQVEFENGDLEAVGSPAPDTARDSLSPWTGAARLHLVPDRTYADAARRETIGFELRVLDNRDRPVRDWNGTVAIHIAGAAVLRTCLADSCLEVFGGCARGFVTLTGQEGRVSLTAHAPPLDPSTVYLNVM